VSIRLSAQQWSLTWVRLRRPTARPWFSCSLREGTHRANEAVEALALGPAWVDSGLVFMPAVGTVIEPRKLTCCQRAVNRAILMSLATQLRSFRLLRAKLAHPEGFEPPTF